MVIEEGLVPRGEICSYSSRGTFVDRLHASALGTRVNSNGGTEAESTKVKGGFFPGGSVGDWHQSEVRGDAKTAKTEEK